MKVKQSSENRVILESADHKAAVSLKWVEADKHWLLSAYAREKGSTPHATIHTAEDEAGDSPLCASEVIVNDGDEIAVDRIINAYSS